MALPESDSAICKQLTGGLGKKMQNRRKPFRRRIVIRQERLLAREKGKQLYCGNPPRRMPTSALPRKERSVSIFLLPFFGLRFFHSPEIF